MNHNLSANFSCRSGYTLKGSEMVTCSSNGQWSEAVPICIRKSCLNNQARSLEIHPYYTNSEPDWWPDYTGN